MPDATGSTTKSSGAQRWKRWLVPATILLMSAGILITANWNQWVGDRTWQSTDDASVRADLTPLSTKVAGLVATVAVSDYQPVKAGDLLVQLRDDDFRAHVQQAEAAVHSGKDALVNNQRQKELQGARIAQADEGVRSAEADIAAAQAGIEAAKSTIANARSGIDASKTDVERTRLERRRQEALFAAESATRQKLEQVVADEERFRAQLASRKDDLNSATAQLASREASGARTGSDQSGLHANHSPGKRPRQRTESAPRSTGQSRDSGNFARSTRGMGAGQL
jgi:membrane fusion protein, multidrug efflux system